MQKLLTLIITGAIIYMIFQQNMKSLSPPEHLRPSPQTEQEAKEPTKEAAMSGTFFERTLSSVLTNVLKTDEGRMFLESMFQPMNKPLAGNGSGFAMNNDSFVNSIFKIKTFDKGEKGPASCGHVVTVNYKILTLANLVMEEGTKTFSLGSGKIAPGVDAVITGMKTGQTRHATITNKYIPETAGDKISAFKVNVLLQKIIPDNFIGDDVKIFDDQIAYKIPLVCGNKAIYHAKITQLKDGKVIYNSEDSGKKLQMIIGNMNYPMIFSHALHNKIPVGSRTVIAKGRKFKSYTTKNSIIFPDTQLPDNEYFMLELFDFDSSIVTQNQTFSGINAISGGK